MTGNPLVFLDTETTGLDPALHEVWEVAYAFEDGAIQTSHLKHDLRTADPAALANNGYHNRAPVHFARGFASQADVALRRARSGATIVGSFPAFDTACLRARWGGAPWHHRLVAVESMAMQQRGRARPKGLAGVRDTLVEIGYEIPEPDHSAAGDVATLRDVYRALRAVRAAVTERVSR